MLEHCWVHQHRSLFVAVEGDAVDGDAAGVVVVPSPWDDGHVVKNEDGGVGVGDDVDVDFDGDSLGILENPWNKQTIMNNFGDVKNKGGFQECCL